MNSPESAPDEFRGKNSVSKVSVWLLATLAGAIVLAFLAGSATPRVRLFGLFPLAIGAFTAYLSLLLIEQLDLSMRSWMIGWIVFVAVGVTTGSAAQAWRVWKDGMREQRVDFMKQVNRMMEDAVDRESARQERLKLMQAFRERTSFPAYLTHRLEGVSERVERRQVWPSPVPEIVFAAEQLLSAIAAFYLSFLAFRNSLKPPPMEEPAP